MNAKRGAASLLLGVLLAACAGTPATPTPVGSLSPVPITTPGPTAIPALPNASPVASPAASTAPTPVPTPASKAAPTPRPTVAPAPSSCAKPKVHVVVSGDTLWDIARQYGVTLQALLAANPQITDRSLIRVGEEVTISPIDLGTLGGDGSVAHAINNRGQVVGGGEMASRYYHAFLWQDGVMTDLGTLEGDDSSGATAINDHGQVVGWSVGPSGQVRAFLWEAGVMTDLGSLGWDKPMPTAINNRGQVVGVSYMPGGFPRAFLWQDGVMTDLGLPEGARSSSASDINDRGQIVGESLYGSLFHAVLWQDGVLTDLGTLGGTGTLVGTGASAVAINERGVILGVSESASRALHPVLWQDGVLTDLGTLTSSRTYANGLNEQGQVIGATQTAVLFDDGAMIDLGMLEGYGLGSAKAINDCGQVVGSLWGIDIDDAPERAVMWTR